MKKEVQIGLRIEQEMYEKLLLLANNDDRSVSYIIRKIISEYLKEIDCRQ